MFRTRRTPILATLIGLTAGSAFAQEAMTVDQAVQIGLKHNPQVVAGQAGVDSALANYHSISIMPPITLAATHVQGTSTAPTLNGTNNDTFLDFGETFDVSGQRRYQAANANQAFAATLYQFKETIVGLVQQIRDGYWTLAAAQAQTQIADTSLTEAQRVYDLTVKQEQAGSSPKGDVIRSSIDVANAKQTLLAAQGAEKTALVAFNTLLARSPNTPEALGGDFAEVPVVVLPDLETLKKKAKDSRPLLKAAQAQFKAADFAVRQAEASRLPDLSIDYQRSTRENIDTLIFSISLPILDFGSISQSVKSAKETRKQTEAQRTQTQQQVDQQVAQAYADLDNAIQSAASYKKEILDPSVSLLGIAQLGYQQGATGILPVIDAESTIRSARVGYINAILAVYKAQDEVAAAVGEIAPNPIK